MTTRTGPPVFDIGQRGCPQRTSSRVLKNVEAYAKSGTRQVVTPDKILRHQAARQGLHHLVLRPPRHSFKAARRSTCCQARPVHHGEWCFRLEKFQSARGCLAEFTDYPPAAPTSVPRVRECPGHSQASVSCDVWLCCIDIRFENLAFYAEYEFILRTRLLPAGKPSESTKKPCVRGWSARAPGGLQK